GQWEANPLTVTGVVGEQVTFTCSHSFASSNTKYFCKETCEHEDVLIRSETKPAFSKGRYRIWDGGNTFNVTITDLKVTDTGMYRCAIDRLGLDTYTAVRLIVTHGEFNPYPAWEVIT
uniref:Immunoglobulin domain-containing protein n=1 Tax=Myripristis murdjan TaxID=586833 RepID=A0A668ASI3_9TELE